MRGNLDALSEVFNFLLTSKRRTTQERSSEATIMPDRDAWTNLCGDWHRVGQDLRRATDMVMAKAEKK